MEVEGLAHLAAPRTPGRDAFSLADRAVTEGILSAAGYYGPDSTAAYHAAFRLYEPRTLFGGLDAATAEDAHRRLHAMIAATTPPMRVLRLPRLAGLGAPAVNPGQTGTGTEPA
ncbi:hypothetical protein [Prauserella flavalba]|uniref:Uncharacterized protein n=1 Tax=Prauserella flavalba TaxID=1477506 RepID=A0A318LMA3_9PSEU|nr:hypothetical protein [Prauserella flavalba]PXY30511.1 hypothetical protein BA062_18275 [Prauserella flavalba]